MKRRLPLISVGAVGLLAGLAPTSATAATPSLLTVTQANRHPTATFAAPGADDGSIYFATRPDRATDGRFLDENVKHVDPLTAEELQGGRWTDSSQLDPGTYFVMLQATDFDCLSDPACVSGFSQVLTLDVPVPTQRFRGSVRTFRFLSTIDLALKVTPLGEDLPYRVCWNRTTGRRRCVRGVVNGFSWNDPGTDTLSIRRRDMRRLTTFTWFVDGRRVASRRARIPR